MNNNITTKSKKNFINNIWDKITSDFQRNKYKYLLILPVLIYLFIFAYRPIGGLKIAFLEYRPRLGIEGSRWVGLQNFKNFLNDVHFPRLLRNTLSISILNLLFGFPAPIILALLLNEVKHENFKRTVQTITYMPYFISMVVVCSLVKTYTASDGIITNIVEALGGEGGNLLIQSDNFYAIYVLSGIWQYIGWNSIIYLAALTSIDQEQYEAARIDGANRFQQMLFVTLPNLLPTIMILFILRMGNLLNVGHEKILLLYSQPIYNVADVISTYTYRRGIINADYSFATAVGLFNSLINVILLIFTNWLSTKTTDSGLF